MDGHHASSCVFVFVFVYLRVFLFLVSIAWLRVSLAACSLLSLLPPPLGRGEENSIFSCLESCVVKCAGMVAAT